MPAPLPPLFAAEAPATAPLLTLYPDGLANLNGEASRLLPTHTAAVQLLPPTGPGSPHWVLLVPPAGPNGCVSLYTHAARPGALRLRALALAVALFAVLPTGQPALRLQLEPAGPGCFRLTPWAAAPTSQQLAA